MTEEALIMSNHEISSNLDISLPRELNFLDKIPSKTMFNKNAVTSSLDFKETTKATLASNLAMNMQANNLIYQKEEASLGTCWRTNPSSLMNTSYVVSSSHTPKSLPSSLSCEALRSSPLAFNNANGKQYWHHSQAPASQNPKQNRNSYYDQNLEESLHSYKHLNINNNNNNNNSLNKTGSQLCRNYFVAKRRLTLTQFNIVD